MDDNLRARYKLPRRDFAQGTQEFNRPPAPAPVAPRPRAFIIDPSLKQPNRRPQTALRPQPPAARSRPPAPAETSEPALQPYGYRKSSRPRKLVVLCLILAALGGAAGAAYHYKLQKPVAAQNPILPLPASLLKKISFPAYYPYTLPSGYSYKPDSAYVQSGLLFFKLINSSDTILFTEQAAPANPVNLDSLSAFDKSYINVGRLAIGNSSGQTSAIVVTDTTLVNINGGTATKNDLSLIANGLKKL
jgi:hypothetical protein